MNDHQRYAYGPKGKEIKMQWKHKHTKKSSVNKEVYKSFLQENLHQFKDKIVIPRKRYNARCHHAIIVKEFATENGINLKYNPPYSPEFNPIELAFNKVKGKYRQLEHDDMLNDINKSFATITSTDCKGFYEHSNKFIEKYK